MSDLDFIYVTYIRTTPEQLWTALTNGEFTEQYYGVHLVSDWQPGSLIHWRNDDGTLGTSGETVLAADPPYLLSYTFKVGADYPDLHAEDASRVTFTLERDGETVKLTLTHDRFDPRGQVRESVSHGWPAILSGLKTLLETGERLP
ncbi:SRPBCC family protein [Crossiella sp. SN42]|uniref:SRPBCC family protein n=1 Tax=Crossiella sp. SN42 TaxID=2944808 RepID=UPI0027DF4131|nr:SRPBCC family protein [Crossiella sp. SN42]